MLYHSCFLPTWERGAWTCSISFGLSSLRSCSVFIKPSELGEIKKNLIRYMSNPLNHLQSSRGITEQTIKEPYYLYPWLNGRIVICETRKLAYQNCYI